MNDDGWYWWWTNGRCMMLHAVDEWRWMMAMNIKSCVMYDKPPCWFACWGLSRCICLAGFLFETKRRHYCWCSGQMTSSKQLTVAAITRTEALTPREVFTGKCVHTQELSPYHVISNTFIAGLGIHIKYCLDHGDQGYCIGHICCSIHSEHGEAMKYKLERSGFRRPSLIFFTSQFASQSLHSGFGP